MEISKKYETKFNIKNLNECLKLKRKILNLKFGDDQYKNDLLVNVLLKDQQYIRCTIAHNYSSDINDKYWLESSKKISKNAESNITKILRYVLRLPKHLCETENCPNIAIFGTKHNRAFRCAQHKDNNHQIVMRTPCPGVDGVCPYE